MEEEFPNEFTKMPLLIVRCSYLTQNKIKKKDHQKHRHFIEYRMGGLQPSSPTLVNIKPVDILVKHISSHFSSGVIISQNNG